LPIYFPLNYLINKKAAVDSFEHGRQAQVVGLIRTLLLKRFESSAVSFQASCEDLLIKLLAFVEVHNPKTAKNWEDQHKVLLVRILEHTRHRHQAEESEEDEDEDIIPEELKLTIEPLDPEKYNIDQIVIESLEDMKELAGFLDELSEFDPARDDKLQTLVNLLKTDPILNQHKVLIFTEYQTTARYLQEQLIAHGIGPLMEVDSQRNNAGEAILSFSPYYNGTSSSLLLEQGIPEIRVLVSTDILAEGLNLQDATCIINYDLHWNPVRLMQRIGRVDRRLDAKVEARMVADHPELKGIRGTVYLWNFLPPDELNAILSLYERVTQKALRISKTFGIEGRKFLTPDDDYEALMEFNQKYEGTTSSNEEMYLAYQRLLLTYPDIPSRIPYYPLRLFSGKETLQDGARGVFFCYQLPSKNADGIWDDEASFTRWYLYNLADETITDDATQIFSFVKCVPETPRQVKESKDRLSDIRQKLDKYLNDTYLKKVQAPIGYQPILLAWMELC
ncbi:MAG: C-terminal helicase domain-containing protein, partial [Anaerolineales bacterium]